MTTKQDYIAVAKTIAGERSRYNLGAPSEVSDAVDFVLDEVVGTLADVFEADNKNFNRERFLEACK